MNSLRRTGQACMAIAVLGTLPWAALAQQASPPPQQNPPPSAETNAAAGPANSLAAVGARSVKTRDRRRAAKLFLSASRQFENGQFEQAMTGYAEAAELDPSNRDYALASQVARSHAVTALIQAAAKANLQGDSASAQQDLQRARALDPKNPEVTQHLYEMADQAIPASSGSFYGDPAEQASSSPILEPNAGVQSFHERLDRRQLIEKIFKAYGITPSVDQSVPGQLEHFDVDSVTFKQAIDALDLVTDTFWVALDAHRVLVARDTRENRLQYVRQEMETVSLPGYSAADMTEISNIAKNVFQIPQISIEQGADKLIVRASPQTLDAFNATLQGLVSAHPQVMLDVRILQLAHINQKTTGVQLPQQVTAFNVYAEEQSILNANQALVQQIISSGLAAPGDTLAILGILIASGQVTSSLFSNGIALFGGGLTLSGLSPGATTIQLNLNSSDSRELDNIRLRLADGEDETLRSGTRYPIMTASYSGLGTSGVNIPGLTTAGTSSGLSSLLSSIAGSTAQIPQVQYQDLGLTLKTNPKVMRDGNVALTLDLKITALAGTALNGIPILNNRSYSGVITLKEGTGAVLMSELNKQESLALTGTPGLTQIPGLNNVTAKDVQTNYATLLIVLTPHLIKGPEHTGRTPMLLVQRDNSLR